MIEGHVNPESEGLPTNVTVRGRKRSAAFSIQNEAMGHELLAALNLDSSSEFSVEPPDRGNRTAAVGTILIGLAAGLAMWTDQMILTLFCALSAVACLFVFLRSRVATLSVGADGISYTWRRGRRRIPYDELQGTQPSKLGVSLDLINGEQIEIPMMVRNPDCQCEDCQRSIRRVVDAVEQRLAQYRGTPLSSPAHRLARGSTEATAWLSQVQGATGQGDYRHGTLSREQLWSVIEDLGADPTARAAAAWALRSEVRGDERDRLRIAAQETSVPKLRIAIESVADEQHDEQAAIEAVLAVDDRRLVRH